MLTFFTTAKAFRGHDGIIQRNALKSWTLLHSDVEVILFGNDEGAAEVSRELGLRFEPHVERHESGAKRLDYIFRRANEIARHAYLCYSNCDIILMPDFWRAFERARAWRDRFLVVAHRWDIDVEVPVNFDNPSWADDMRQLALTQGIRQNHYWIDFFLFRKGLCLQMPPLIVGHGYWDNWMIWNALNERIPVLDASRCVVAAHQNHGYSPVFKRIKGVSTDPISLMNLDLIGGLRHLRHINCSTHIMGTGGWISWTPQRQVRAVCEEISRIAVYKVWLPLWHGMLGITRPVRTVLGLRSKNSR
jgi:hypothetical protein